LEADEITRVIFPSGLDSRLATTKGLVELKKKKLKKIIK